MLTFTRAFAKHRQLVSVLVVTGLKYQNLAEDTMSWSRSVLRSAPYMLIQKERKELFTYLLVLGNLAEPSVSRRQTFSRAKNGIDSRFCVLVN